MRIGHGYDVHKLAPFRALTLGGVLIPFDKGLWGHSDADVLTHALIDAMLGASGLGDIGRNFPDSDPAYKDISSLELLRRTGGLIARAGFTLLNADCSIIAQQPRLAAYISDMEANLCRALGLNPASRLINVKATTEEGLGFTGEGLGIAAHSVCLITEIESRV